MRGECCCCGYTTTLSWVDVRGEDMPLCVVCKGGGLAELTEDLPEEQKRVPQAIARIANALIDGHGVSYRASVEMALEGEDLPQGEYTSL